MRLLHFVGGKEAEFLAAFGLRDEAQTGGDGVAFVFQIGDAEQRFVVVGDDVLQRGCESRFFREMRTSARLASKPKSFSKGWRPSNDEVMIYEGVMARVSPSNVLRSRVVRRPARRTVPIGERA